MLDLLQRLIHWLESGAGAQHMRKWLIRALIVLLLLGTVVGYNLRGYRNLATQEGMDLAQLARNLAEGRGYTTLFIRPFSIHLVKTRNEARVAAAAKAGDSLSVSNLTHDLGQLKGNHPDLANPPLYPLMLAGAMKLLPFRYPVDTTNAFWSREQPRPVDLGVQKAPPRLFWRYQPDFLVALINQLLFLVLLWLTFRLARSLFDATVGWLSVLALLGSELLWRFTASGLSTILLMLVFLGLVWCLVLLERESREPKWGASGVFLLAALTGVLLGLGGLTRYSFAWLVVPVLGYLVVVVGAPRQRSALALLCFACFVAVLGPWLIRNYLVSGAPCGTASFTMLESTWSFPGNQLQQSLEPKIETYQFGRVLRPKLAENARHIFQNDLPKLGGTWLSAFFLVGLLLGFQKPGTRRLRYFVVGSLVTLALVQTLGKTQLSVDSPDINSENLLVLVAPLVVIYGVSLFIVLLDQVLLPTIEWRYLIMAFFGVVVCLPMLFVFLGTKAVPVTYPPYYPPAIQRIARWVKPSELIMSDVPWAAAWYGQMQSVWLTHNVVPTSKDPDGREAFLAINDWLKPVSLLYLTPVTTDAHFFSDESQWVRFSMETLIVKKIPAEFPLGKSPTGSFSIEAGQIVLADWERWQTVPQR